MNVQSILGRKGAKVATIRSDATLEEVMNSLGELGFGALVVSDDGETIAGIISERDIVRSLAASGKGSPATPVRDEMSADVVTCSAGDGVDELMALMTGRRIRHLPVVDSDNKLAGIISIGDVVKARLASLEQENQALASYISGR